jgi:exodeoxyribonuclease-3
MRLATWNVNSLKIRLPHLIAWLGEQAPDVVCLQELKLDDERFPHAEIEAAGYRAAAFGQKTYNGVAILSRHPIEDVQFGMPSFGDEQRRLVAATIAGLRIACAYVPNGQSLQSDKYRYKLDWLAASCDWLRNELALHPRLVFAGDLNIAPEDRDVHDPALWQGQVLVSEPERQAFHDWLALGLQDSFRLFEQPEKSFSWWDYRQLGFQKNHGLRIDHILLSAALAAKCAACRIDRAERKKPQPSDHAPVIADLRG